MTEKLKLVWCILFHRRHQDITSNGCLWHFRCNKCGQQYTVQDYD